MPKLVDQQWFEVQAGPFEVETEARVAQVNLSRADQGLPPMPALIIHTMDKEGHPVPFSGKFHVEKACPPDGHGLARRYYVVKQTTVRVPVED